MSVTRVARTPMRERHFPIGKCGREHGKRLGKRLGRAERAVAGGKEKKGKEKDQDQGKEKSCEREKEKPSRWGGC